MIIDLSYNFLVLIPNFDGGNKAIFVKCKNDNFKLFKRMLSPLNLIISSENKTIKNKRKESCKYFENFKFDSLYLLWIFIITKQGNQFLFDI